MRIRPEGERADGVSADRRAFARRRARRAPKPEGRRATAVHAPRPRGGSSRPAVRPGEGRRPYERASERWAMTGCQTGVIEAGSPRAGIGSTHWHESVSRPEPPHLDALSRSRVPTRRRAGQPTVDASPGDRPAPAPPAARQPPPTAHHPPPTTRHPPPASRPAICQCARQPPTANRQPPPPTADRHRPYARQSPVASRQPSAAPVICHLPPANSVRHATLARPPASLSRAWQPPSATAGGVACPRRARAGVPTAHGSGQYD